MKTFTKDQLRGDVQYNSQSQTATITGQFLLQQNINILCLQECVQYFKNHILEQKDICFSNNPNWPTQYLILDVCQNKKIIIESAWLVEMIKMYQDNFEMQLTLSKILGLFIMCDQFAMAQNDEDIVVLDYLDSQNSNDKNLNEQLNKRNN